MAPNKKIAMTKEGGPDTVYQVGVGLGVVCVGDSTGGVSAVCMLPWKVLR
jgi:hypothetical protein